MFQLKKLLNPFRHQQYTEKQLIDDLRKLVDELNARLKLLEDKINTL